MEQLIQFLLNSRNCYRITYVPKGCDNKHWGHLLPPPLLPHLWCGARLSTRLNWIHCEVINTLLKILLKCYKVQLHTYTAHCLRESNIYILPLLCHLYVLSATVNNYLLLHY